MSEILAEFDSRPGDGEELVTRRELAGILGVHPITVKKWEDQGLPVAERGARGIASKYSVRQVRAWHAARGASPESQEMPTDSIGIKARKEHFQTLLAQQKFEERAKRLIPIHEVERAWSMIVVAVRSKLLALPQTLSDKLYREATLHGLEGVERALDESVRDVLRELAGVNEDEEEA